MVNIEKIYNDKEINAVVLLATEIWLEYYKNIISIEQIEYMLNKYQNYNAIKQAITEGSEYYILFCDGKPSGYFCVKKENNKLFLSKLYIIKNSRGKGFATKITEYINGLAKLENLGCIYLTVNRQNYQAIAVYRHLGFVIENAVDTDIGGNFYMNDYILYKYV